MGNRVKEHTWPLGMICTGHYLLEGSGLQGFEWASNG